MHLSSFFCISGGLMKSTLMISGVTGLGFITDVMLRLNIGFRVGNVPSISHVAIGGRDVRGLFGWPEHKPG